MESRKTDRTESHGSSPKTTTDVKGPSETSARAAVGGTFTIKTDTPAVPLDIDQAFENKSGDLPAAGNQAYTIELKELGRLQRFLKRTQKCISPIPFELKPTNLFDGARLTIREALLRLHRMKKEMSDTDFMDRVDNLANQLASGCNLTAYLKCRALILHDRFDVDEADGLRRPRAATDLPIPTAFAFAIQQLGRVDVADLPHEFKIMPIFPQTGHKFGIPTDHIWNPHAYAEAVEYARNLGMRFAVVDLKVKNGSPWWFMKQYYFEDVFELRYLLPETNYTDGMLQALMPYLHGQQLDPTNNIVNLGAYDTNDDYGIILQSPHVGFNVSCFEALADTASEVWSNV